MIKKHKFAHEKNTVFLALMELSINTAQNVHIAYTPAGLAQRIWATLVDFAILGGISSICFPLLAGMDAGNGVLIIFSTLLLSYHFLCELFFRGRSVGKMTQNLRVVRIDGKKVTFWDYLLRWVLRLVDISISLGIVGMLSIILSPKMQRLGDIAAGTTVIYEKAGVRLSQFAEEEANENYEVVFREAALLSDKDIRIIQEAQKEIKKDKNQQIIQALSLKIKELTGIQTELDDEVFIETVLKDHHYLTKE